MELRMPITISNSTLFENVVSWKTKIGARK